jgi:uncharacterized protein YbjT (DUF2867 family)
MRALVTGATGFVGGQLAALLAERGHEVRCLVRDRERARDLADQGFDLHEGDVLDAGSLRGAGEEVDIAYYLVHSMGRGSGHEGFMERERTAAATFAGMAKREGVARVVYLGGLGEQPESEHLRSRAETAEVLQREGPPLTYFRASMVIGAGSESYRVVRYLVQRLPAMIAPSWLRNRTQPIAAGDVLEYLAQAAERPETEDREVQIGGPDVLTYGQMLDQMADVLEVYRRPKIPVPLLSPKLSSHWIRLVTPVDSGVAKPIVESLVTDTVVVDPGGMKLFDVEPIGCREALQRARADELRGE